jgi:hypothetical protein
MPRAARRRLRSAPLGRAAILRWLCGTTAVASRPRGDERKVSSDASLVTPRAGLMGQAPHYLQGATNPAVSQALLTYVTRLLALELAVSPLDAAVQVFRTQCDQAVAQDAATQAYVRQ